MGADSHIATDDQAAEVATSKGSDHATTSMRRQVTGLVHHLRNELNIASGLNAMMRGCYPNDDRGDLLDQQDQALNRMRSAVSRVLRVARLSHECDLQAVDLNTVVPDVARLTLLLECERHQIDLTITTCEEPAWVEAPPVDTAAMLEVLLTNAREALETVPESRGRNIEVVIHGSPRPGFSVHDDGPGIRGFEKITPSDYATFFHPGRTTKPNGSGIGLSWALETVERLGWEIEIESGPDKGTVVRVMMKH